MATPVLGAPASLIGSGLSHSAPAFSTLSAACVVSCVRVHQHIIPSDMVIPSPAVLALSGWGLLVLPVPLAGLLVLEPVLVLLAVGHGGPFKGPSCGQLLRSPSSCLAQVSIGEDCIGKVGIL